MLLTIEVSWAGEAAECQLVGETLIVTYTRQIFVYAKYVFWLIKMYESLNSKHQFRY